MAAIPQKRLPTGFLDRLADETWRYKFTRNVLIPWLFILPLLSIHVFVVAIPAVQGIYMSLTDWSGVGRKCRIHRPGKLPRTPI